MKLHLDTATLSMIEITWFVLDALYCNSTYDGFLCWPPTLAGEASHQHCPDVRLSDPTQFAFRRCSAEGAWTGRRLNDSSQIGWTNYTPCFPALVQSLFDKVYDDEGDAQAKFKIAELTRYMEMIGYFVSLLAVMTALFIFRRFRSLLNTRTLIHCNLFCAMLIEITIRQCLYIDQFFGKNHTNGLSSIPYLCEGSYVFLEYATSVIFTWMCIEGVHLNNLVTNRALRYHGQSDSYLTYLVVGWILPILGTLIWAFTTGYFYYDERVNVCWYGYNFQWFYWLAQGPRCTIIALNLVFLLNIMRVLVLKIHQTADSEKDKIKKALRAALILLPLLGITNALSMIEPPLESSVAVFGTWCFITHFLRSFQGFLISLFYCFLNGEVQMAISKQYTSYRIMREYRRRHREILNSIAAPETRNKIETRQEIPMQELTQGQEISNANNAGVAEVQDGCTVGCQSFNCCCQSSPTTPPQASPEVHFAEPPVIRECRIEIEADAPPRTARHAGQGKYPVTPPANRVQFKLDPCATTM